MVDNAAYNAGLNKEFSNRHQNIVCLQGFKLPTELLEKINSIKKYLFIIALV